MQFCKQQHVKLNKILKICVHVLLMIIECFETVEKILLLSIKVSWNMAIQYLLGCHLQMCDIKAANAVIHQPKPDIVPCILYTLQKI